MAIVKAKLVLSKFKLQFPVYGEQVKSYTPIDSHTLKLTCYSGETLVYRYIDGHRWSLQTELSYKE